MEFIRKRKSLNCLSLQKRKHNSLSMDASITSPGVGSSADEAMLIDSDNENDIPDMEPLDNRVLKDVVAYVEVRTKTENRSNSVRKQLELLGATVVMRFSNDEPVTHVIWKDGKKSTKDKALKRGLHLVSVLWVDSCKQNQHHVAESMFPVADTDNGSPVIIPKVKRLKSMQPKSFEEDLQSSTERVARKRKRKALVQPLNVRLNSPGVASSIQPHVYVEETQDPYTPVGTPRVPGIKLTPSLIPDTPASMRACLDALSRVRNSGGTHISERLIVGDSPTFGTKPDILQKKLSFSLSVDAEVSSAQSTEATNSKPADKSKIKKGRRSEAVQGSAKKVSPKIRRLSLRIEKALSELETDEDSCLAAGNNPDTKTTLAQRNLNPQVKQSGNPSSSDPSEARTTKNVSFIKEHSDSHPEPGITSQRKRKLLPTNLDIGLNQVLTEPTKSSKKENQPKEPRRSSKSSRKLSDKFDSSADHRSSDLSEKQLGDLTENTSQISKGTEKQKKEPRRSSKTSKNLAEKFNNSRDSKISPTDLTDRSPKDDSVSNLIGTSEGTKPSKKIKGTRKRKTEDLSSGSSEEETGKAAKKRKADKKAEESHKPSKDDTTEDGSRRSLDDFSQRKRLNRLKTKGRSKPRGNRTVPLATPHPDSRETSSEENILKISRGKKGSRSLSLTSKSLSRDWDARTLGRLDSSSEGSERSVCKETGARQGKRKSTKKPKNNKPSLVMTSIHGGDRDLVVSVVKKLKGFCVEERVSMTTTHIICGENRRTLNVLRGIARGCWLLSLEWVLKSLEAEKWLPEELYEVEDFFPSAKKARLERSSTTKSFKQDLFSTMGAVFINDTTSPPKADLTELLELCRGQTCSSIKQASVCIGGGKNQCNKVPVVSERWLLDCVTQHQQLPFEDYLL